MASVLVIGGTGRIGRAVTLALLRTGVPVRVLTRRPSDAGLPSSVHVVGGDLTMPESLGPSLRDVASVFLIWTVPPASVPAVVERLACSATHVVFLSSPHQMPHPAVRQPNPMAILHAEIERAIVASGVAATILRPGMFASNARYWWASMIRKGDVVRWPYGAAESAPIDDRDIATVAARVSGDTEHAGRDYVLTGPESLSQVEQVGIIGAAIGRRIRFQELSPDEFRQEMMKRSPGPWVDMLLAAWRAAVGYSAFVTSSVSDLIGSAPRTFSQWAADYADAFR
jgi:uncharacterized protein YbjT (DUF2867 family)